MNVTKLVIMRHGESQWNKENRFTGWVDVNLSDTGRIEARHAAQILKKKGFIFHYGYTSVLKRAIHTLWIILEELNQEWLPIEKSWKLNERHYGILQGINKDEAVKKYGYDTIQQWRRSFTSTPPDIAENNEFIATHDERYSNINSNELPKSESLASTSKRVIPYWTQTILPHIKNNKNIILVAHGNSIRAIIKFLNKLNESEIFHINIPTGVPLVYEFDQYGNPVQHYYLSI